MTTTSPVSPGLARPRPRPPRAGHLPRAWRVPALLAAVGVLACAVVLSLAVGTKDVPLADVWTALTAPTQTYADAVIASRVPRTQLAAMVGAALAVAGALMQGIARNPLGDPGLLGVNAGASAGVVTAIALTGGLAGSARVWAAIPGALIAAVAVYLLGAGGRGATPVRLVLAGAVVSAVLLAYVQGVALSQPFVFDSYRFWVVGSVAGRMPSVVLEVLPFVLVGLVVALILGPSLNVLALGEEQARALGACTGTIRVLGILAATLLAAAAVAAAGPIAFVGLAVPHMVRSLTGPDYRWLLPFCAVLGPALVIAADVLGRVVMQPGELMVGVVTAVLGAPFLIAAVRRSTVKA